MNYILFSTWAHLLILHTALLIAAVWKGILYAESGNGFVNYFYCENLIY